MFKLNRTAMVVRDMNANPSSNPEKQNPGGPTAETQPPSPSRGGPQTGAGKEQSSRNSLKHGLTAARSWSGVELAALYGQAHRLAGQLGITTVSGILRFNNLFSNRDRDLAIAAAETLLLRQLVAGGGLGTPRPAGLPAKLSVSTLQTLKRQIARQARLVTKDYQQVLALAPTGASAGGIPVTQDEEFSRLAGQLKIAEPEREAFCFTAALVWSDHPPVNRLALLIALDLILDEWRIFRLQGIGLHLLKSLAVSAVGEQRGFDFALLQDVQGFNAMDVLQDLEAALRKRIEKRVEQLALANAGPWPPLTMAEPAAAHDTESDNPAETEPGVDVADIPAATAATQPENHYDI